MANTLENPKIALWDGYEVEVDLKLFDDFDFATDMEKAQHEGDHAEVITMYFATIGGESVYNQVRQHITEEKGYFSVDELAKVIDKINAALPKAGNRAERRSWRTSR